jgi:hypothetical protein
MRAPAVIHNAQQLLRIGQPPSAASRVFFLVKLIDPARSRLFKCTLSAESNVFTEVIRFKGPGRAYSAFQRQVAVRLFPRAEVLHTTGKSPSL